ncbi:MAG: nucleotidyltransferase family protein [Deltaproteobacteria bacterium]|nr:nucleotidyltransferase family protein [Deltaproteobacteria bacterium]
MNGSDSIDAVVMAGDKGRASRMVLGTNKALLEAEGVPFINWVLSALEDTHGIQRIIVLGPRRRLEEAIARAKNPFRGIKEVVVLEQEENFLANAWKGFIYSVPCPESEIQFLPPDSPVREHGVLYCSCDIPLLIAAELEEFLSNLDIVHYDYFLGLTAEADLEPFYPTPDRPGIKMACFHFRDGSFRQNNIHFVKPLKIKHRSYIQDMYNYRYQRQWGKIIGLGWEAIKLGGRNTRFLRHFFSLHLARAMVKLGLRNVRFLRHLFLNRRDVESSISPILGTRFTSVLTSFGGAALDVDSEEHYAVMKFNFSRWRDFLAQKARAHQLSQQKAV